MIAEHFTSDKIKAYPNVDNVTAFVHATGCGMADSGDGFEALQRVLWGYAKNPNVAGVLMVGLGCEINQIDWLLEAYQIKKGPYFQVLNIQNLCGLRKTVEKVLKNQKYVTVCRQNYQKTLSRIRFSCWFTMWWIRCVVGYNRKSSIRSCL